MIKHEALLGIRCNWLYLEAGHSEAPCDGVRGAQTGQPTRQYREVLREYGLHRNCFDCRLILSVK